MGEQEKPIDWARVLRRDNPTEEAEYQGLIARLQVKYPALRSIAKRPHLTQEFYTAVTVVGRMRKDPSTKTHVGLLTIMMMRAIPAGFFGAYRVHRTERGDILFVGREPLPWWARVWNASLLVAVLALVVLFRQCAAGLGPVGH